MTPAPTVRSRGSYRWLVCGLLFFATAINYIDRQMIGVLKPVLQADLGWTESQYADVILCFQAAYAIGFVGVGRFIDAVGTRWGYAIAFSVWTIAHVAHGLVHTVGQFALVRFVLGIGEAGNFPAGLKAVTEWFPQRERALATGLFNAGANVGAIATPLIVASIAIQHGWRSAFFATGILSLIWLVLWLLLYRSPRGPSSIAAGKPALAEGDPRPSAPALSWRRLLGVRQTWAYAIPKLLTDPIWWMFLFWLPDFLSKRYGLDLRTFGPPLVAIYALSDVGSVLGGWASSRLIRAGRSVNAARKLTMLACAIAVLPILAVQFVGSLWCVVLIIGLATAAHQAFSANLLTLPSDMFPPSAVGSVVGIGGAAGAIGGMLIAKFVGYVLDAFHSYAPVFAVAAGAYLFALLALHLISPRLAPTDLRRRA